MVKFYDYPRYIASYHIISFWWIPQHSKHQVVITSTIQHTRIFWFLLLMNNPKQWNHVLFCFDTSERVAPVRWQSCLVYFEVPMDPAIPSERKLDRDLVYYTHTLHVWNMTSNIYPFTKSPSHVSQYSSTSLFASGIIWKVLCSYLLRQWHPGPAWGLHPMGTSFKLGVASTLGLGGAPPDATSGHWNDM